MSKVIGVDREKLVEVIKSSMDGHISYKMGGKALTLNTPWSNIDKMDCSGYVRKMIHDITHGQVIIPDGSWNQRDWVQKQGFATCNYKDCSKKDDILRIAFLNTENGEAGHVWLCVSGLTIESHGRCKVNGVIQDGPSRRPWNWKSLYSKVDYTFMLTEPMNK